MIPEGLAQAGNLLREVVVDNGGVGPDEAHQLVLFHDAPRTTYERQKRVEASRREGNRLVVSQQPPPYDIETERSELVGLFGIPGPMIFSVLRSFSAVFTDFGIRFVTFVCCGR